MFLYGKLFLECNWYPFFSFGSLRIHVLVETVFCRYFHQKHQTATWVCVFPSTTPKSKMLYKQRTDRCDTVAF